MLKLFQSNFISHVTTALGNTDQLEILGFNSRFERGDGREWGDREGWAFEMAGDEWLKALSVTTVRVGEGVKRFLSWQRTFHGGW